MPDENFYRVTDQWGDVAEVTLTDCKEEVCVTFLLSDRSATMHFSSKDARKLAKRLKRMAKAAEENENNG